MEPLNQRQGFLVSAIVHLTLLMIMFSRQFEPSKPAPENALPPSERTARVFVPPAEVLKQVLPPSAHRPAPRPVPPPPPPSAKDRISIGPPVALRQKGPLILRPDDDFTKAPKGRPDVVPTPAAPAAPKPAAPEPVRTADASTLPKAPGREGFRLPPGLGRDLSSGAEGSKEARSRPTSPSIASSLRNFEDKLQTGQLGIPTGSGEQQIHGLLFDPMGADFSRWITHFTREVYRNWIMPQPALMGMRGHVDIEFRVERDGTLSLCRVLNSSTNIAMDRSAKYALESSQFLPLPDDYGPSSVTMRASFFYNEAPSGS